MKLRALGLLGALIAACGGGEARVATDPSKDAPPRTATGDLDIRKLVLDMAATKACAQLDGKWLGLPAQDDTSSACPKNLAGADAGLACSWGRLQIRDCKSTITDGTLSLSFGGVGWTWVDRKSGDVGVRQYVYLTANVEMKSAFDIGYDPTAKIASVWLTPTEPLKARVNALGTIKLVGDGVIGQLEKAAATALGVDPKHQFAMQGAQMFEEKLRKGMTMTFDTSSQQVDLMLSPLPNGIVPKRPLSIASAHPWLLNERQEVFPGGVQFSGPYEPAPAIQLDAKWEGGSPVSYGIVCATDATNAADALARGDKPSLVLQSRGQFADAQFSKVLAPPACPWVLVTSSAGTDSTRFALQISQAEVTGDAGAASHVGVVMPTSTTVWVTVMGFEFESRKPDGKPWDFGGGAPDPQIWIKAASGTKLVVVPKMQDTFKANPMLHAPAAIEVSTSSPLVVGATDIDVESDDPMGEATITLDDVVAHRDLDVEIKLNGTRTGTLRVKLDRAN